jgi:REP element-mobilizing transposase RayT
MNKVGNTFPGGSSWCSTTSSTVELVLEPPDEFEGPGLPVSLWSRPRHLPHYNAAHEIQMITYCLSDSLPKAVIQRKADEMLPDAEPAYRKRIESQLDLCNGSCVLRDPLHARMVIDTWRHFDGDRYHLVAWVVMPNHVHVMIRMNGTASLPRIVQSWKSYTGRQLPVSWQREYWDRFIRDEKHYHQAIAYIEQNPVNAGLYQAAELWCWSSAFKV